MKILLVILGVVAILIRLFGLLPWTRLNSGQRGPVRFNFLVGLAIFVGVILFVFWFAMR
jgi:hypothetical protein